MDIHPYLEIWSNLEPSRCKHIEDDTWQFRFSDTMVIRCDVVSFHGTAVIEDLLTETMNDRAGWSFALTFDRAAETFSAVVFIENHGAFQGLESLNPSISLLSAYLAALKGHN